MTSEEVLNLSDIVKLALDAGINEQRAYAPVIQRFAELVAAAEREACIQVINQYPYWLNETAKAELSSAIRSRSKE